MQRQRRPLTRTRIITAARKTVARDGANALSLRPLARRLGVTAPALYDHFASKDELLTAVAEDEFGRLIAQIEAAAVDLDEPLARIASQSRAYVTYAVANPALFEVIFQFRPAWSPASAAELPLASKAFEISMVAVEEAIDAGLIHERDPLLASLTIWAAVHGVATFLAVRPGLGDAYEAALVDSVIDNLIAGLTQAGSGSRPTEGR